MNVDQLLEAMRQRFNTRQLSVVDEQVAIAAINGSTGGGHAEYAKPATVAAWLREFCEDLIALAGDIDR